MPPQEIMIITQRRLKRPGHGGVGVRRGQRRRVHRGPLSRDGSRWSAGPHTHPACRKLFNTGQDAGHLRQVLSGSSARAAGDKAKFEVLIPWRRWRGRHNAPPSPGLTSEGSQAHVSAFEFHCSSCGEDAKPQDGCGLLLFPKKDVLCGWVNGGVWVCVCVWGAGRSPTTPLQCVNEKEPGQEESAFSTTEVMTGGTEGG